jgi:uncharacterized SAM-binding protein YcdF (DUF218 family)
MFEAGVVTLGIWCGLYALHVLPGPTQRTSGAGSMVLIGIACGVMRARRALLAGLAATMLLVAFVAFSPFSQFISRHWVRDDRPIPSGLQAVVALSAGLNPDTTVSSEAVDHLLMGLALTREHDVPLLVTTSTQDAFPSGIVEGQIDQARIMSLMQARVTWLRANGGETTRDEALATAAILQPRHAHRIAVVTSPMHTRRACAVFERVGFDVTCIAARMRGAGSLPLPEVPDDRLTAFGNWVYEVAASMKYRANGWLP